VAAAIPASIRKNIWWIQPHFGQYVLALVRHEELDVKRLQGRLIEGQRTFDIADGQNNVVEDRSPPSIHQCFDRHMNTATDLEVCQS
jgi:hypothetical protein